MNDNIFKICNNQGILRGNRGIMLVKAAVVFFSLLFALVSFAHADTKITASHSLDFRSLSLEDCLVLARNHNPVLGGTTEKIRELTADYRSARSRLFPRITSLLYYQRLDPNRLPPGGTTAPPTMDFNNEEAFAGITVKQILFDGGTRRQSTRAAKIGARAQRQDARRTGNEVTFEVTRAFYRLLEAKEDIKVAEDALRQRLDFADLTKSFFKAGKVTKLDFFRADAQASDARQTKIEAQNALRLARVILARTIGLKESVKLDIRGRLPEKYPLAPTVGALWAGALKNNPEIKQLNLQIEQGKALISEAKGGYYPEVSLQGDIGVRHQDTGGTKGEWLAGIFVDFPLFEGGSTKAHITAADSRYLQLLEEKRARLNSLKIDLASAWRDWDNARNGIADTRRTIAVNQEAYASAQSLYRNGKAIGLDVLQAQLDLTASQFNLIRYETACVTAMARARQIVGAPVPTPVGERNNRSQTQ